MATNAEVKFWLQECPNCGAGYRVDIALFDALDSGGPCVFLPCPQCRIILRITRGDNWVWVPSLPEIRVGI